MANEILNALLKEYEQKKVRAEIAADERKEALYKKIPRLQTLENEINTSALATARNILNKNRENAVNSINLMFTKSLQKKLALTY